MDEWLDELLAALRNVELRLDHVGGVLLPIRPDQTRERARREWRAAVEALGEVIAQAQGGYDLSVRVVGAARSSLAVELLRGDEMRRRDLLRFTGMFSAAAILPPDVRARIAEPMLTRVDRGVLDVYAEATASYARGYYAAAPDDLLGVVRGHVNQLAALGQATMSPDLFQRWGLLVSDAAALAGWLALDAERRGDARAYFALARDAAHEAGNEVLHALAIASLAGSHDAQHGGDPREATRYLRQATAELPDHAPDYARAWLHAQTAKEEAAAGDAYAFQAELQRVDRARERGGAGETPGPFWSATAWFSYLDPPGWRDDHQARGLAYLGSEDAGDALRRLLNAATDQRTRARLNVFLADWHLGRDEPVEAAAVAVEALGGTPNGTTACEHSDAAWSPTTTSPQSATSTKPSPWLRNRSPDRPNPPCRYGRTPPRQ